MKSKVTKSLLGLLVVGLLLSAWGGMVLAEEPRDRGFMHGTLTAIAGAQLVVATTQGEQSVSTAEGTVFRVPGVEEATLADVAVGDYVVVRFRSSEDGTLLAVLVAVIPAGQEGDVVLRGLIMAVEGTTLTVRTGQGTVNVLTDEQTLFHLPRVEEPTVADVGVGQVVLVLGRPEGESFRAAAVAVVSRRAIRRHTVRGRVSAVDDQTLTVDTPRGEQLVFVDDQTRLRMPGVETPGLSDITPGMWVVAAGFHGEDGGLQARVILVISEHLQRRALRGEVTAIEGNVLTLETQRGEVQVLTDENTRYRSLAGAGQLSLGDIEVGSRVLVLGRRGEEGDALAVSVILLPQ